MVQIKQEVHGGSGGGAGHFINVKEGQWVKVLATKTDNLGSTPESTLWKERAKLSSGCYMSQARCCCTHTGTC